MRQSQKMEAVGQLTGGIAHDFNNMLSIVIGSVDIATRRLRRGDMAIERYLENAHEGATRAATLTQRLLAFSRQSPLSPSVLNLNSLVANMSELLRRTLGEPVVLETVLAGGLWAAHADPNQLENAIINLAVNARDAMPQGGKLTIETANAHLDDRYAAGEPGLQPRPIRHDRGQRCRHGHGCGNARARFRSFFHYQAGWPRHRPGPIHGVWLCQAIRRPCTHLFGAGARHEREDLLAASFRGRS